MESLSNKYVISERQQRRLRSLRFIFSSLVQRGQANSSVPSHSFENGSPTGRLTLSLLPPTRISRPIFTALWEKYNVDLLEESRDRRAPIPSSSVVSDQGGTAL